MRRHVRVGISHPLLLKDGEIFLVSDEGGRITPPSGLGQGLFYRDCRYLAHHALTFGGTDPVVLSASAARGFSASFELTNIGFRGDHGGTVAEHGIAATWQRMLDAPGAAVHEQLVLRNCTLDHLRFAVGIELEARFEDIFTLRGHTPRHRGTLHRPEAAAEGLQFRYDGADGIERRLMVAVTPAATARVSGQTARLAIPVTLAPQATAEIAVTYAIREESDGAGAAPPPPSRQRAGEHTERIERGWLQGYASLASDDPRLDAVMARSLADIRLLSLDREGGRFIAAGVPWFVALFGRDSLVPALQCLAYNPDLAGHSLRVLAHRQGTAYDPARREAPGKILHEMRVGELAAIGEVPQHPGYGSVDSTLLFLIALARHAQWAGTTGLFEELRPAVDGALQWLARDADADQDGYVDYDNGRSGGPTNQGWKDSGDAVTYPDGSLVRGRIALVEVQGYAYLATALTADLFRRVGDTRTADRLVSEAAALAARFNRDFWMEDEGCYCLALDESGAQVRVVSSNPGQAMWTGIADPAKAHATAARLMRDDMFSGWGVRTLSMTAGRYNPIGYHTGGVWPFDNSLILAGLRRYGEDEAALQLFAVMRDAALGFDLLRLPEFFCGAARRPGAFPAHCPRADPLQAWSAGALPMMVTTLLGLEPDGFAGRLVLRRPLLPPGVARLRLRRLRVGRARADLRVTRQGDKVEAELVDVEGALTLAVEE